ncbi:phosphatidate cytidylyltransferase [Chloroflexota bacterium]
MLIKRFLAALLMAAIGIPAVIIGGIYYFLLIGFFLLMAAWEYVKIFEKSHHSPSMIVTVGGVLLVLLTRNYLPDYSGMVLTGLILLAMTVHLITFEKGRDTAATDFAITLGGILYLGWLGAYLVDIRTLPQGLWWFFLTLGSVWIADSAAYFIGSKYGKHKLSPRLSPRKSWEGYFAGVFFGTLGALGLTVAFQSWGGLDVSILQGGLLGLVMSVFTTLGDLGESMIKRQSGVKDSSNIIPGHGGFLDRIDAWLWAAAIGYFIINWIFLG